MGHHARLAGLFEDNPKVEPLVKLSHFSKHSSTSGYRAPRFIIAQNEMSEDEFKKYLDKEYWTVLETIHVLSGMEVSEISSVLLTQRAHDLYDLLLEGHKNKDLELEPTTNLPEENLLNLEFEHACLKIQGVKYGIHLKGRPYIFLEWAFEIGFSLPNILMNLIGVSFKKRRSLGKHCIQSPKSFCRRNYKPIGKPLQITLQLQATAQVLWYYNSDMPITHLYEHEIIQKTEGSKFGKEYFRKKVAEVDPRDKNKTVGRPRKLKEKPTILKAKTISKIFTSRDGNMRDYARLRIVCSAIISTLYEIQPNISSEEIANHPLIQIYMKNASELVWKMFHNWIEQCYPPSKTKASKNPKFLSFNM